MARAAVNGSPAFIPAFTPPQIGGLEPLIHVKKYFGKYHEQQLVAGHDECTREEALKILTSYQEAVDRENAFNARAAFLGARRPPPTDF